VLLGWEGCSCCQGFLTLCLFLFSKEDLISSLHAPPNQREILKIKAFGFGIILAMKIQSETALLRLKRVHAYPQTAVTHPVTFLLMRLKEDRKRSSLLL